MDIFNSLVNIVRDTTAVVQSGISSVVGGFVAAMFLRGNTQRVEFEKIKMGKVKEAIDDLVKSHELTLTELVKCKNLLQIAEVADRENKAYEHETNTNHEIDFDWFLRFFEAAGNISNEDMQLLWARILAGEVHNPGAFSFRTIETLRNMTQSEAIILHKIARLILFESDDQKIIYESDYISLDKDKPDINMLYGIGTKDFNILEECGIIKNTKKERNAVSDLVGGVYLYNGNILLEFLLKSELNQNSEELHLEYFAYLFTRTGIELISIINEQPNDNYILDLGLFFREKYPNFTIKAYKIIKIEDGNVFVDYTNDLLDAYKKNSSQDNDLHSN